MASMTEDELAKLIADMMREERVFECFLAHRIAAAIHRRQSDKCPDCDGTGETPTRVHMHTLSRHRLEDGKSIAQKDCETCDGSGRVELTRGENDGDS